MTEPTIQSTKRFAKNAARLSAALLAATLFFHIATTAAHAQNTQSAAAYAVMDDASGHVLLGSNAEKKLQVGSLTKIATACVVLDWLELTKQNVDELAVVPQVAATTGGLNAIGFQPGDSVTLRDLLYAALLQSDNIAALTLANHVGEHLPPNPNAKKMTAVDRFVAQMNALARRLRMTNTLFVNPHGIDSNERKLPFSTASDMARLTRYAENKSQFRFYVSQKDRKITVQHADGTQSDYLLQNTNLLLGTDTIDGVKTGTTRRAGECVIISAARAPESIQHGENNFTITPRRLIVVVLGSSARFDTALQLLRSGWDAFDRWTTAGKPLSKNEAL